jgi:nicotinamide phosphoribosyltransferase
MFKPLTTFYADGYKIGHKAMLAPGTTRLYGTWIPRSTKRAPKGVDQIVSFGQQLVVKWLNDEFTENFFNQPIENATRFGKDMTSYLGLEYDASHFEDLHKLGYLPIRIKSLPEGILTNPNVPHMTFVNTVDGFAWLTLYVETIISSLAWKSSTSATLALKFRKNAEEWVSKTDPENMWLVDYLCHDFSARGLDPFSMLSSGLGHATSFRGSDSIIVIPGARYFYNVPEDEVCINSVNASEHSVSTTKIFTVGEQQMIADWLKIFPAGILSIVSDTFDLWKLITEYLPANKEAIMARDGKLVIRPDSGNPVDIISGSAQVVDFHKDFSSAPSSLTEMKNWAKEHLEESVRNETPHGEQGDGNNYGFFKFEDKIYRVEIEIDWNRYDKQYYFIEDSKITSCEEANFSPEEKGVIELLWDIFGGTVNEKGYKVLDSHIGAIYGDSITLDRQIEIYQRLEDKGFAATNVVLGVGSYTYQYNTRDTMGFAAKGSWFEVEENGKRTSHDIYKDPITDDGTKKSLKGLIQVFNNRPDTNGNEIKFDGNDILDVNSQCTWTQEEGGLLQTIFENGNYFNQVTLDEVRKRLSK